MQSEIARGLQRRQQEQQQQHPPPASAEQNMAPWTAEM